MKELLIIGARGFGREVYSLAKKCIEYNVEWKIKGFLDDNKNALDGLGDFPPIIDSVENYIPTEDDVFICALGSVKYKKKYSSIILAKGGSFINLIHPTSDIYPNAKLGKGLIVMGNTTISDNAMVGDFVTILGAMAIGHDTEVGKWCHISTITFLGGFCKVGAAVSINVGALVIDRITIGDNAVIGAGSVVIKNVKPGVLVFGNPAREIGPADEG